MRIALKLIAGFVLVAAMAGLVGYLSGRAGREIESQLEQLSRSPIVKVVDAARMAIALDRCHLAAWALVAAERSESPSGAAERTQEIADSLELFQRSLDRSRMAAGSLVEWAAAVGELEVAQREQTHTLPLLDDMEEAFRDHRRLVTRLSELAARDAPAAETFLRSELLPHFEQELLPLIRRYRTAAEADFTRSVRTAERAMVRANARNAVLTIAAVTAAVILGLAISRHLGRRLIRLQDASARVGRGDLEARVEVRGRDEITQLSEAFNRMVTDLRVKTVSKDFVDSILDSMREMLVVTDSVRRIQAVNPATLDELGYTEEQLLGKPVEMLIAAEDVDGAVTRFAEGVAGEGHEMTLQTAGSTRIPVYCSMSPLRDAEGEAQGFVCLALNIAQRKADEAELQASLEEKELLLREVHHRVKNNLQVISSLLNLQVRELGDSQLAAVLLESQGRIRSMALIHEQLYRSERLARVDFAEYLRALTAQLAASFGGGRVEVEIQVDALPEALAIDTAIPCGMIVNELVSNAMKHAFPGERPGRVEVGFCRVQSDYLLTVADDGVGPGGRLNPATPRGSLGMKVVDALVRQLSGSIQTETSRGTRVRVRFPLAPRPAEPPRDG